MKALYPFTLLLLGAVAASAQTAVRTEAPTGVTVVKYSWRNDTRPEGWDQPTVTASDTAVENPITSVAPVPERGQNGVQPINGPTRQVRDPGRERRTSERFETRDAPPTEAPPDRHRRTEKYAYEVKIKNDSAVAIEGVEWDYVFIEPVWGTELARHRFHSFSRGKPGKSVTLKGDSAAPPTRVVSAAAQPGDDGKRKLFEERIVIKCVLYADGTVRWRDSGAERDCEAIRARAQAKKEGDR